MAKEDTPTGKEGKEAIDEATAAAALETRFTQISEQVENLNKALDSERKARKDAERKLTAKEEEGKTKTATVETLSTKLETLEGQLASERKKGLILPKLQKAHDASDVLAFIDIDQIESAEDAEAAIKELVEKKPYLFKQEKQGGVGTGRVDREVFDDEAIADPASFLKRAFGKAKAGTEAYSRMSEL